MKIAVAYIRGPRGFKGELAAALFKPSSASLRPGLVVTILKGDKSSELEVEYIKSLRRGIGLKLIGIDDEETADGWRGAEILVEAENLEPLGEKEFYHFQLEGSEICEQDGTKLGVVERIDDTTGNALLTVKTDNGEILIPFVEAVVKSVDIEKKMIIIKKIEGLY